MILFTVFHPPTLGPSFMFSACFHCVQRPLNCFGLVHLALLVGQYFLTFVFLMVQRCDIQGEGVGERRSLEATLTLTREKHSLNITVRVLSNK